MSSEWWKQQQPSGLISHLHALLKLLSCRPFVIIKGSNLDSELNGFFFLPRSFLFIKTKPAAHFCTLKNTFDGAQHPSSSRLFSSRAVAVVWDANSPTGNDDFPHLRLFVLDAVGAVVRFLLRSVASSTGSQVVWIHVYLRTEHTTVTLFRKFSVWIRGFQMHFLCSSVCLQTFSFHNYHSNFIDSWRMQVKANEEFSTLI